MKASHIIFSFLTVILFLFLQAPEKALRKMDNQQLDGFLKKSIKIKISVKSMRLAIASLIIIFFLLDLAYYYKLIDLSWLATCHKLSTTSSKK